LRVAPEYLDDDEVLHIWLDRGLGYARTLPPK
jgi:hypothetical protein